MKYEFICVKHDKSSNELKNYTLYNNLIGYRKFSGDEIKDALRNGIIQVINLKLTKDGKLVSTKASEFKSKTYAESSKGEVIANKVLKIPNRVLSDTCYAIAERDDIQEIRFKQTKDLKAYVSRLKSMGKEFKTYCNGELVYAEIGSTGTFVSPYKMVPSSAAELLGFRYNSSCRYKAVLNLDGLDLSIPRVLDSSFFNLSLGRLEISDISLNNAVSINNLFHKCIIHELVIRNISMDNVLNAYKVFSCSIINNLIIENVRAINLRSIAGLFYQSRVDNLYINNINVSNLVDVSNAFEMATVGNFSINNVNTESVVCRKEMFKSAHIDNLDLRYITNRSGRLSDISRMFYDCNSKNIIFNSVELGTVYEKSDAFSSLHIANLEVNLHELDSRMVNMQAENIKSNKSINIHNKEYVRITDSMIKKIYYTYCINTDTGQLNNDKVILNLSKMFNKGIEVSKYSIRFKRVESIKELKKKGIILERVDTGLYVNVENYMITVLSEKAMVLAESNSWMMFKHFYDTSFYSIDLSGLQIDTSSCKSGNTRISLFHSLKAHEVIMNNMSQFDGYTIFDLFNNCYVDIVDMRNNKFNANGVNFIGLKSYIGDMDIRNTNLTDELDEHLSCYIINKDEILNYTDYVGFTVKDCLDNRGNKVSTSLKYFGIFNLIK